MLRHEATWKRQRIGLRTEVGRRDVDGCFFFLWGHFAFFFSMQLMVGQQGSLYDVIDRSLQSFTQLGTTEAYSEHIVSIIIMQLERAHDPIITKTGIGKLY